MRAPALPHATGRRGPFQDRLPGLRTQHILTALPFQHHRRDPPCSTIATGNARRSSSDDGNLCPHGKSPFRATLRESWSARNGRWAQTLVKIGHGAHSDMAVVGEASPFPDLLHIERIVDAAAGQGLGESAHRHVNLHQIFLIRGGGGEMSLDGARYPLTARRRLFINIPPGTVHDFRFAAGTDGHVLTLPPRRFPRDFRTGHCPHWPGPSRHPVLGLPPAWTGSPPDIRQAAG